MTKQNTYRLRTVICTLLLVLGLLVYVYANFLGQIAQAAPSTYLNFQGRLKTSSGAVVPDGTYNLEFKLYDTATDGTGTNLWTETRTGADRVRVVNGYFSVSLGSVTAFPGTIDWSEQHWITMNVGGTGTPSWDGEMTNSGARMILTAVPYAFQADKANSLTDGTNDFGADDFVQIAPSAPQTVNDSDAAVAINQTGSGGLLQLQSSGNDVLTLANDGDAVLDGTLAVNGNAPNVAGGSALSVVANLTSATNAQAGLSVEAYVAPGSASTHTYSGLDGVIITSSNNLSGVGAGIVASRGSAVYMGTGTLRSAQGGAFTVANIGSGTITEAMGLAVFGALNSGGTITRATGVGILQQTHGANNVDLHIGMTTTPTGNWSIYNDSAYDSYFAGALQVMGRVTVGTSDTTGTLLVLDTKTDAGDPSGVNGGMYYNESMGKFRCYENGNWVDCINSGDGPGELATVTAAAQAITNSSTTATTGSFAPSGTMLYAWVSAANTSTTPSFDGFSFGGTLSCSWTYVDGLNYGGRRRANLYYCDDFSGSGTVSVTHASADSAIGIQIFNASGVDTSEGSGSGIVGWAESGSSGTPTAGVTVSGTVEANDITVGLIALENQDTLTAGANWSIVDQQNEADGVRSMAYATSITGDLSASAWSWSSGSSSYGVAGFILKGVPESSAINIVHGGNTEGAAITIGTNDTYDLNLETDGTTRWTVAGSGHLLPGTDDAYDIGSSTSRVRDLYLGPSSLHIGTDGDEGVLSYDTTNNAFNMDQSLSLQGGYLNFGTTSGDSGIGIRNNGGTIEIKDENGCWFAIAGGGCDADGSAATVASYTKVEGDFVSSTDLLIPSGTTNGDLLLVAIYTWNNGSTGSIPTAPSGWSQITTNTNTESRVTLYYRIASGDTPGTNRSWSHSFNWSNGVMLRITGADTDSPIHAYSTRTMADDAQVGFPAITTTENNMLGIGLAGSASNAHASNSVPNWTNITTWDTNLGRADYRTMASAGTYAAEEQGVTETGSYVSFTVAIAPAVGTPVGNVNRHLSNLSNVAINTHLLPGATDTIDLGSSGARFRSLYMSGAASIGGTLTIGASDTTGTLLVLDTKTDSGDPSGVNGAMYYNSDAAKFRCFEDDAWVDCIGAGGGGSGDLLDGGNTTGAALTIGTNDAYQLNLETDGTTRWTVGTDGHFIPGIDDTYDIGSDTNRVRDLYLGPASLHIGVSGDEGVISYDTVNNNLQMSTGLQLASGSYLNFGGSGYSGYGIRDNNGVLEVKDQGGSWVSLTSLLSSGGPGAPGGGAGQGSLSPIPQVESYTTTAAASVNSLGMQIPAGVEEGDLLVAMIYQSGNGWGDYADDFASRPSGWRYEYAAGALNDNAGYNSGKTVRVYSKVVSDETPGATVNWTYEQEWYTAATGGVMLRISGASQILPINAAAARTNTESIYFGTPALTTTISNTLGLAFNMSNDSPNSSYTIPNWTPITYMESNHARISERDMAAADTYDAEDTALTHSGDTNIFLSVALAIAPASQTGNYPGEALLQDDFNDDSIDTNKWSTTLGTGTSITETSGQLVVGLPTASGRNARLYADTTYDVRDRWVGVELTDISQPSYLTGGSLVIEDGDGDWAGWYVVQGDIYALYDNGGGQQEVFVTSYNSTTHAYFRIREASGVTYWETSENGQTWNTHHGRSNVIDMSNVIPRIQADTFSSTAGSSTYTFDNFYLGTSDQYISINTSNYVVLQGGNSLGQHLTIGTLDSFNLSFMAGGQQVAVINGADGSALFNNSVNSTTAFQVQNATGTTLFNVDSANSRVYIGNPTADNVGALLVLDTKNTSGDPTGVDGSMYYNSSTGKFRCYEDGTWKNCIAGVSLAVASTAPSNTVSGTTSETNFSGTGNSYEIPANSCVVGKTYRVTAVGVQSYAGGGSGEATVLKLKLGSTTLATTDWTWFGSDPFTDQMWKMEAQFTCTEAPSGASAIEAQGVAQFFNMANSVHTYSMKNTSTVNAATNANQTLQISAQIFNTADVGDSITMRQFIVEEMGN